MLSPTWVIGFLLCGLIAANTLSRRRQLRNAPLPPGPPRIPLLGNARDMPRSHEWLTYSDWAKHFGTVWVSCIWLINAANHIVFRRHIISASLREISDCVELLRSGKGATRNEEFDILRQTEILHDIRLVSSVIRLSSNLHLIFFRGWDGTGPCSLLA